MPRPKRMRKMTNPPIFKGFRPIGNDQNQEPVIINFEEYESIRLCDFELNGQEAAAQVMEISRPTFTRIYESARRKVAQAFVLGKPIVFEGGKVYFDSQWFSCNACGCWFNNPGSNLSPDKCALCRSDNIKQCNDENNIINVDEICICPECGTSKKIDRKAPFNQDFCPKCNHRMERKGCKKII